MFEGWCEVTGVRTALVVRGGLRDAGSVDLGPAGAADRIASRISREIESARSQGIKHILSRPLFSLDYRFEPAGVCGQKFGGEL